MTKYNTGNPVGSADPRDLYDTATVADKLVQGTDAAYPDRLGVSRRSWKSIENEAAEFFESSGYEFVGDYAAGIEITRYSQVVRDTAGEFWRASGSTTLPYTTTGAGLPEGGAFVAVGDAVLRQDLVQPVATFNNVADMKAGASLGIERKARTLGYYTPGDGGGNDYEIVAAATGTADGGSFIDLDNGLQAKGLFKGGANVKQFGAKGDGVTDDTVYVQACLYAAKGSVHFPAGTYLKNSIADSQWVVPSDITIYGDGHQSIIYFDDDPDILWDATNRVFLITSTENVTLRDFAIHSNLSITNTVTNGKQCMAGSFNKNLSIKNLHLKDLRWFATSFGGTDGGVFEGNTLENIGRDGARFIHSRNVIIRGNKFINVTDDAVALHSSDAAAYSDTPLPIGHVVTGNIFEGSFGVRALGIKGIVVSNNTFRRAPRHSIDIEEGWSTAEGNTPQFAITISNNIILDSLALKPPQDGVQYAIKIVSQTRSGDVGVSESPYAVNYGRDTDENGVAIGSKGIRITNNQIGRTLPTVSAYSKWGYGLYADHAYNGDVFFHDPAVDDSHFAVGAVYIEGPTDSLDIIGNTIWGLGDGAHPIKLTDAGASEKIHLSNAIISHNTITDCPAYGVVIDYEFGGDVSVDIASNTFDLDPYFRDGTHNTDNTWINTGGVRAVQTIFPTGFIRFKNNTCKNLAQPINIGADQGDVSENILYADAVSSGNNESNKGVRVCDIYNIIVHYDADPTSSTYGSVLTVPKMTATSAPSSGKYVSGHFVSKKDYAVISGSPNYIITGWARLTTGTGHTLGVDWAELQSATS